VVGVIRRRVRSGVRMGAGVHVEDLSRRKDSMTALVVESRLHDEP
jgi:hypothetical protein